MSVRNVYVHVDSSNRLKSDANGGVRVHVPHGLQNATRVAVKAFSLPNTADNLYGEMHKLRWIEYYKSSPGSNDAWAQKEFYIDLSDVKNYTTTAEIVNEINTRLADPAKVFAREDGSTGHKFGNENPLTIQLAYDATTYKISILASSTLQKVFAYREARVRTRMRGNSWALPTMEIRVDGRRPLTDVPVANYIPILTGASSSGAQSASAMNERLKTDFYAVNGYSVQTLNTVAMRTLQAPHHSTHENFPGIYLCSDALSGDGLRIDPTRPDERRYSVERPRMDHQRPAQV
jgi:hypothetical protein